MEQNEQLHVHKLKRKRDADWQRLLKKDKYIVHVIIRAYVYCTCMSDNN